MRSCFTPDWVLFTFVFYLLTFIFSCFFDSVFCHPSAGDEKKDLELQRRLASLNWITWEQLEIPVDFDAPEIDKMMKTAQNGTKSSLFHPFEIK